GARGPRGRGVRWRGPPSPEALPTAVPAPPMKPGEPEAQGPGKAEAVERLFAQAWQAKLRPGGPGAGVGVVGADEAERLALLLAGRAAAGQDEVGARRPAGAGDGPRGGAGP